MPAGHLTLGREGEDEAARLLTSLGLRILARNYSTRLGEVDLICRHGDTLVFVEVKTPSLRVKCHRECHSMRNHLKLC